MTMDPGNPHHAHQDDVGRWHIWRRTTGERLTLWPIDAQAAVATGDYTLEPPAGAQAPEADLRGHVAISEPLKVQRGVLVEHVEPNRVPNEHQPPLPA